MTVNKYEFFRPSDDIMDEILTTTLRSAQDDIMAKDAILLVDMTVRIALLFQVRVFFISSKWIEYSSATFVESTVKLYVLQSTIMNISS